MENQKKLDGAIRLTPEQTFFDPKQTYGVDDWLFRAHSYYEMLLVMVNQNHLELADKRWRHF